MSKISSQWMWQNDIKYNHIAREHQAQDIAVAHSERSVEINRRSEDVVVGMMKAAGLLQAAR